MLNIALIVLVSVFFIACMISVQYASDLYQYFHYKKFKIKLFFKYRFLKKNNDKKTIMINKKQLMSKLIKYKIDFDKNDFKKMTRESFLKYYDLYIEEKERIRVVESLNDYSDFKKRKQQNKN